MASTWGKRFFLSNPLGTKLQAPERVVIYSLTDLASSKKVWMQMLTFQWKFPKNLVKIVENPPAHHFARTNPWLYAVIDGVCRLMGQGLFSQTHHVTASALVGSGGPHWVWLRRSFPPHFADWKKLAGNCFFHLISEWFSFLVWTCLDWFLWMMKLHEDNWSLHRMQETKHLQWRGIHYFGGPGAWDLLILLACNIAITQAHRAHTFLVREFSQRKC